MGDRGASFEPMSSIPAQRRLEKVIVEVLIHEIAGGKGGDPHEFPHIFLAHASVC